MPPVSVTAEVDRPAAEVVESDPPRTWRVRGIDGPIRAIVDVAVSPIADDRSRVTIAVDFEGRGIGRLLVPLVVRREARTEMPANIAVLTQRLENRQARSATSSATGLRTPV
jgi:hypothetical protein